MNKSTTRRIVVFEPDAEELRQALVGRSLNPELVEFLRNLLKTKKWTRKINIPSGHNNVAAVLVFTTALKEGGLEIFSELHVFLAGQIMIEKWQVVGEGEHISQLPQEAFLAIDIEKVRVDDKVVTVEFNVPMRGGHSTTLVKTFDFSADGPEIRFVPHPLLDQEIVTQQ
jgi:hypothetical protein